MTLGERLKTLRNEIGLSQEALGSQGFISAPGWIKIENGQRHASEKLLERLIRWLIDNKHMKAAAANTLRDDLLTLKYLGSNSKFIREMAKVRATGMPNGNVLMEETPAYRTKPRRGRPPKKKP